MKNFDEYKVPNDEFWGYEAKASFKRDLIEEIDNTPLTSVERKKKLAAVNKIVADKRAAMDNAAHEKQRELSKMFWADADEELGYSSFLDEHGVRKLEALAYNDGHSHGFSEIYHMLSKYCEFLQDMRDHFKQ
jgi:hypothetical protein